MSRAGLPTRLLIIPLLVLALGCYVPPLPTGSPFPTELPAAEVTILNVDGPDLEVRINGAVVGMATCGGPVLVLRESEAGLPSLPWSLEFVRADGRLFGTVTEDVSIFKRYITIRGDSLFAGDTLGVGPAPVGSPCATT